MKTYVPINDIRVVLTQVNLEVQVTPFPVERPVYGGSEQVQCLDALPAAELVKFLLVSVDQEGHDDSPFSDGDDLSRV